MIKLCKCDKCVHTEVCKYKNVEIVELSNSLENFITHREEAPLYLEIKCKSFEPKSLDLSMYARLPDAPAFDF